jgi:hypothetical protein
MRGNRVALVAAVALAAALGRPAAARVLGGGNPAVDCYVTFEGITGDKKIECGDGDRTCDADRKKDGQCTFAITVCAHQSDVPGCTPATVTELKGAKRDLPNRPPLPASAPACGSPNDVVVKLKKNGTRANKHTIHTVAIADRRPKKDGDQFMLKCVPGTGAATTLPGPRAFSLANGVDPDGSHFFSSAVAGGEVSSADSFTGSLALVGGTPDASGVASLAVAADSILAWSVIDGSVVCLKVEAAGSEGKIDCDGGTPVDATFTQNSNGAGDPDAPVLSIEQGAPGVAGAGYVKATTRTVNLPSGSAPAECAAADYSSPFILATLAFTTGQATAEVTNARGPGGAISPSVNLTNTGVPFDCSDWTEDGAGILVAPLVGMDTIIGDVANVLKIDD